MIVILGGSGFVGTAFQRFLKQSGQEFAVVSRRDINYGDPEELIAYLNRQSVSFLINAAGYTGRPNVDACELHKAECLSGNAVLPGIIREACEHADIPWGHVSSGCIYTGTRPDGNGFTEQDAPNFDFRHNNCSFYSGCKSLGEEVLQGARRCYIWRLRIPFDELDSPRNYISKMIRYDRLLNATNSLSHLGEFVAACMACWTKGVEYGTYNLTNPGFVTTKDVVALIQKHGLSDREFRFFDSEDEFMRQAATTPRSNCVLDCSKAIAAGLPLSPVQEALEKSMRHWVTG
ncbi:MAG: sugar nucleotide-binding protein [Planctomycetaceae bacterium]